MENSRSSSLSSQSPPTESTRVSLSDSSSADGLANRTGTSIDSIGSNGTRLTAQQIEANRARRMQTRITEMADRKKTELAAKALQDAKDRKLGLWTAIFRRYFNATTITGADKFNTTTVRHLGFRKTLEYAPYFWGKHGIPLPGMLAGIGRRMGVALSLVLVPTIPLLAHSIEPDSCAAAMYFSGFNLLLWATAGVWQGMIGHGVCAGIATALFVNGYNHAQKSVGNDESAFDTTDRIAILSCTVGIVTAVIMGLLQKYAPLPALTTFAVSTSTVGATGEMVAVADGTAAAMKTRGLIFI